MLRPCLAIALACAVESATIVVEAGGAINLGGGDGGGGGGDAPTLAQFEALASEFATLKAEVAEIKAAAGGYIMPGAPPPPAEPDSTPPGNFLTSANGVIAGPSTEDGNMDGAGPGTDTCPPVTGEPGSAVMDGSEICTLFAENAHSRLNIIFKFPSMWTVARIWLLRGVHSPNYGPKSMVRRPRFTRCRSSLSMAPPGGAHSRLDSIDSRAFRPSTPTQAAPT
jgi:hypothetical protein